MNHAVVIKRYQAFFLFCQKDFVEMKGGAFCIEIDTDMNHTLKNLH